MNSTIKSERERIKALMKKHWNVVHPNYPSKLAYLFALIDEEQEQENFIEVQE